MKRTLALLLLLSAPAPLFAQKAGDLGAGVVVGDPTGLTAKYWLDGKIAVDGGWGFNDSMSVYGDVMMHIWDLWPQPKEGRLPAYFSLGMRVKRLTGDTAFGFRTMAGTSYFFPRHPLEVFLEMGPLFRAAPDAGVDFDIGAGLRAYFGRGAKRR